MPILVEQRWHGASVTLGEQSTVVSEYVVSGTLYADNTRLGLFAFGNGLIAFDDWTVRTPAGCTGGGDYEWSESSGAWSPVGTPDCACNLAPPIRPGAYDGEIAAGRCGPWV